MGNPVQHQGATQRDTNRQSSATHLEEFKNLSRELAWDLVEKDNIAQHRTQEIGHIDARDAHRVDEVVQMNESKFLILLVAFDVCTQEVIAFCEEVPPIAVLSDRLTLSSTIAPGTIGFVWLAFERQHQNVHDVREDASVAEDVLKLGHSLHVAWRDLHCCWPFTTQGSEKHDQLLYSQSLAEAWLKPSQSLAKAKPNPSRRLAKAYGRSL